MKFIHNQTLNQTKQLLLEIEQKLVNLERERDELIEEFKNSTIEDRKNIKIKMQESEKKFKDLLQQTKIISQNINKLK